MRVDGIGMGQTGANGVPPLLAGSHERVVYLSAARHEFGGRAERRS